MGTDRELVPHYAANLLVPGDFAHWEVTMADGSTVREAPGLGYPDLDLERVRAFRIVHEREPVFQIRIPADYDGRNLIYRRRTTLSPERGRVVWFVIGFLPEGPAYAVDVAGGEYVQSDDGFMLGNGPLAAPQLSPNEVAFLQAAYPDFLTDRSPLR